MSELQQSRKLAAILAIDVAGYSRRSSRYPAATLYPHAVLAAYSPLNPEAPRPLFKTWFDGLRKAGLDVPDEPTTSCQS